MDLRWFCRLGIDKDIGMKKATIVLFIGLCLVMYSCKKSKTGIVTEPQGIYFREQPSTTSKQIGFISYQTKLEVLDDKGKEETLHKIKANWFKVKYKDRIGWVFGGFVEKQYKEKSPVEEQPIIVGSDVPSDSGIDEVKTLIKLEHIVNSSEEILESIRDLLNSYKGVDRQSICLSSLTDKQIIEDAAYSKLKNYVIKEILKDERFTLIERESLTEILKEHQLGQTGVLDLETQKELKLSGAVLLLLVEIKQKVIELKIVEVETARILSYSSVTLYEKN